ncbi:hypothetical protein O1W69_00025 [Chlamydia sp. 12-01]|uniref:polymorphic outer membrane protein middle domain-containing protein n=1 Tax=Chlamydia sp. 12-01 TaxID=3002742 RepID=UPI0035D4AA30
MKHPVYWFLISSGLIASTSLSFAQADNKPLSSGDSFNGNTSGNNTFTPKETSNADGTTYTCEGDVCIANANTTNKSCFTDTAGNLSFLGNGFTLCFENIDAGASNPGAINVGNSDKSLSIIGFSLFTCSSCPPKITGMGAIKSSGSTTFNNDINILLKKNCSKEDGGAVNCKGFILTGTLGNADFTENKSEKNGGAINTTTTSMISNNNRVVFSKNSTVGASNSSGGAIYCKETTGSTAAELKLEGNQQLIFSENSSSTSGGAIYANKLTITSGGTTIFANNFVSAASNPQGGAICLSASGECSLTANLGDIIFDGNTLITTPSGSNSTTKRNAIDLNTTGKFVKLNAREGFGIYFYDPIANNGDSTTTLSINKPESSTNYHGRIVFSGETLSTEEKAITENLTSTFKQPVTLSAGALILREGAILEAKSFEQTASSTVIMDVGTTLQTPTSSGEAITLPNLGINVASLGGGLLLLRLLKSNLKHRVRMSQLQL